MAEWKPVDDHPRSIRFYCTRCRNIVYFYHGSTEKNFKEKRCDYWYCPYCRAVMDVFKNPLVDDEIEHGECG